MLYVAAGTVHTIGGGMILVETQQTSDVTYRLYDYGRPREIHIVEGLAATRLRTNAGKVVRGADLPARVDGGQNWFGPISAEAKRTSQLPNGGDSNVLVRSPYFQVEKMRLQDALQAEVSPDSPHIIVAIDGAGIVESHGMEPISFNTGDAVVVPACVHDYTVRPQWELEMMRMSLPAGLVSEPQTELPQSLSSK